jgi:hypothetical protein
LVFSHLLAKAACSAGRPVPTIRPGRCGGPLASICTCSQQPRPTRLLVDELDALLVLFHERAELSRDFCQAAVLGGPEFRRSVGGFRLEVSFGLRIGFRFWSACGQDRRLRMGVRRVESASGAIIASPSIG